MAIFALLNLDDVKNIYDVCDHFIENFEQIVDISPQDEKSH